MEDAITALNGGIKVTLHMDASFDDLQVTREEMSKAPSGKRELEKN